MNCIICQTPLSGKQRKYCSTKCKNDTLQSYAAQQERGNKRKAMLIEYKGGKCQQCGYHKNVTALCFHHLDPSQKELKLTIRECSNNKLEVLLKEAEKCIILCANCHQETHNPDKNEW